MNKKFADGKIPHLPFCQFDSKEEKAIFTFKHHNLSLPTPSDI